MPADSTASPTTPLPPFEEALTELEQIIDALDSEADDLNAMISKYERGSALLLHCQAQLTSASLRIERVQAARTAAASTAEPADAGKSRRATKAKDIPNDHETSLF